MEAENLIVKKTVFPSLSEMFNLKDRCSIIAGPCSVESIEQIEQIAETLIRNNVKFLRGGAFKPRSSPYDFQGLGLDGLKILNSIGQQYGLLIVSEIMEPGHIEYGLRYTDIIQIGSRNMQNTPLLKEVGKTNHPVLLKRGMMSTVNEFILAAEYIAAGGNRNIILCERGIRTFEDATRNTLDISAIAIIQKETYLPVIADLSHSLGRTDIIEPVAKAVLAMNISGIMLEVHNNPANALSDSKQQMSLEAFSNLMAKTFNKKQQIT